MRRGAPILPIPKLVLFVHGSRPETGIAPLAAGSQSCPAAGPVRNVARMVIVVRNRTVNQIPRIRENPVKQTAFLFTADRPGNAFTPDSSRYLNCRSNLIGHDAPI